MSIPTQREYLDWRFTDALTDWRTSHGEARERARYELSAVIDDFRKELRRADASFRAAVERSKRQQSASA